MGTQQSCCVDFPHNKEEADEPHPKQIKLTHSVTGKYVPCRPYLIAEQANLAYQQLLHQFSNNRYLDIQLPPETEGVREMDGYYKMSNFDACYCGEWKDHHPHGRGMATLANGSLLVGSFVQGSCTGDNNYFFFKDGSTYFGNIIGNHISGKGKLTTTSLVYKGDWLNNLPHGEGSEIYANGDKFIGSFNKGMKQGEECTFTWANNEKFLEYRGGFWNGRIQGMGTLVMSDKTTLQGYFEGNCINNLTITHAKVKFKGSFEVGKASGKGLLQLEEFKEKYDGNFKEGKLYGSCRIKDGRQRETDVYFFEGRQFKRLSGLSDQEAMKITKIVEAAYSSATKHSDALAEISQDLQQDYQCRFVQPFENLFKYHSYVAMNVYDKVLLVRSKKC